MADKSTTPKTAPVVFHYPPKIDNSKNANHPGQPSKKEK
jgi:hypothetical protein